MSKSSASAVPSRRPARPDGAGPGPGTAGHVRSVRRDGRARGRRGAAARRPEDLSEEALYWGCKRTDGNWKSGTTFGSASTALGRWGQPLEVDWPYDPKQADGIAYPPPGRPGGTGWFRSGLRKVSVALADVRSHLDGGVPVLLGLTVFDTLLPARCRRAHRRSAVGGERAGTSCGCRGRSPDRRASHPKLVGHHLGARWLCVDRRRLRRRRMPGTLGSSTPRRARPVQRRRRTRPDRRERRMELGEYQREAQKTDQLHREAGQGRPVARDGRRGGVAARGVQEVDARRRGACALPRTGGRGTWRHPLVPRQHGDQVRPRPRRHRGREPRQDPGPLAPGWVRARLPPVRRGLPADRATAAAVHGRDSRGERKRVARRASS